MTMGRLDAEARMGLMRSTPEPSGRKMSRITQEGWLFSNASSPSALLKAETTCIPLSIRRFLVNWLKTGSSSMRRTVFVCISPSLELGGKRASPMPAEGFYRQGNSKYITSKEYFVENVSLD